MRTPITIINWRGNVSDLKEAKKNLKDLGKEFDILLKKREKELKKKPSKKELSFYLSVPTSFIYPLREFLKEKGSQKIRKIIIGGQDFDELDKTNKNNATTLTQIKSIGAKFVILNNDNEINKNEIQKIEISPASLGIKKKEDLDNIFLQRLKGVSKKNNNLNTETEEAATAEILEEKQLEAERKAFLKAKEKEIQKLEERLRFSLENKMATVLVVKNNDDDLNLLISFIKRMIKNIHYNLFDKLFICYETGKNFLNMDRINLDDCQEKVIAIRRTAANIFGIDNAKKIRILYSGVINSTNVKNILKEGSVDGVLINNDFSSTKDLAKILVETIV